MEHGETPALCSGARWLLAAVSVAVAGGCSSPEPFVDVVKLPREMRVGIPSRVELTLVNRGSAGADDKGIVDVTFVGDPHIRVRVHEGSERWDNPFVYPPGSVIWHKERGEMRAKDLLVSAESTGWGRTDSRKLVLEVTPSRTGKLKIPVSGVLLSPRRSGTGNDEYRYPTSSESNNQQGHPCIPYEVIVQG